MMFSNEQEIIGTSRQLQIVCEHARQVSFSDAAVLITGETGVGKELIARFIHYASPRVNGPFIVINTTAIPGELFESELFGHEKGSFTGARDKRIGKFELAHKGTIFLDEIGEMQLHIQAKFLRVLEEKKIQRVGGNKIIDVDIRVIAATNKDLEQAVENGTFRQDLYYRLNVFFIHVPPLRERKEDIPLLAEYYVKEYVTNLCKNQQLKISSDAMKLLIAHSWPGNVRELQNCLHRAVLIAKGEYIQVEHINFNYRKPDQQLEILTLRDIEDREIFKAVMLNKGKIIPSARALKIYPATLRKRLKELQINNTEQINSDREVKTLAIARKEHISKVMELVGGNKTKAARLLGISRSSLWRYLVDKQRCFKNGIKR